MAPTNSKANYKTFEAQARMVRAIVAAHPEVKWNYKEIVACYGSDMTEHALNHRFRRIRAQALIIHEGRKLSLDMKNLGDGEALPGTQEAVDKKNIAKYFGQSTADGIQFQFRSIKKDAEGLRQDLASKGEVAPCQGSGPPSTHGTPSKSAAAAAAASTPGSRKRQRATGIKRSSTDDDDQEEEATDDWSEKDETPSKRPSKHGTGRTATPGQKNGTPARRAATKAHATIARVSAQLGDDDSPIEIESDDAATTSTSTINTAVRPSIFGGGTQNVDRKPVLTANPTALTKPNGFSGTRELPAFTQLSTDPYMSTPMSPGMFSEGFYQGLARDQYDDGEI